MIDRLIIDLWFDVLVVRLQCGYLSMPNAVMHSVTWTDMNMLELGEDRNPPTQYQFNFTASQSLSLSQPNYCLTSFGQIIIINHVVPNVTLSHVWECCVNNSHSKVK